MNKINFRTENFLHILPIWKKACVLTDNNTTKDSMIFSYFLLYFSSAFLNALFFRLCKNQYHCNTAFYMTLCVILYDC